MTAALCIDDKLVTSADARRVVKARRPHANVRRTHCNGWPRTGYSVVSDPTGDVPWCYGALRDMSKIEPRTR